MLTSVAHAGEWRIDPFVGVDVTATDNVNSASGSAKESDLITRLNAGVIIGGSGKRANLNLNYSISKELHLEQTQLDDISQSLAAIGSMEIIKDSIFVDGSASIQRIQGDSNGQVSATDRNTGANQRDVYLYSISPYWRHRYAGFAESELRLTRSQTFTSTPDSSAGSNVGGGSATAAGSASDTQSNGVSATLAAGSDFNRFLWKLSGSATESKRSRGTAEFLNADATLQYNISNYFALIGSFGDDEIDDEGMTKDVSGPYALAGFIWTPSERTRLRFQSGWRYNRVSYSGEARWNITGRTSFQATYSESVGLAIDQALGALGATQVDPRGRIIDKYTGVLYNGRGAASGLSATDNLTLTRTFVASLTTAWTRDSLLFSFTHAEQDTITDSNPGTVNGPGLRKTNTLAGTFSHQLTSQLSTSISLSYSESSGSSTNGGSEESYRAGAGLNYLFSETLTGSLSYNFLRRESSGGTGGGTGTGTGDLTENAIVASLRKSF